MAGEELVARGHHELHSPEQSATGVPAGVERVAGVGTHRDDVVLAIAQPARQINLEAHVAIVGAAHALTIEVDVADIHDASEVEHHVLVLQAVIGVEVIAVPPLPHLLEAATRQAAHDVRCHIGVVAFLAYGRRHPRLFYLEVVWQANGAPRAVVVGGLCRFSDVAGMEAPAVHEVFYRACLCLCDQRSQHH